MTFRPCPYEEEVRQVLQDGHWPAGCSLELRHHVRDCPACNDLVLLTTVFQTARDSSLQSTSTPPSLVWWRAQLRRRRLAAQQVSTPVTVAQILAWSVTLISLVALIISQYRHGLQWASWWPGANLLRIINFSPIASTNWDLIVLIPTLGALGLIAGVVVYLVSEKS